MTEELPISKALYKRVMSAGIVAGIIAAGVNAIVQWLIVNVLDITLLIPQGGPNGALYEVPYLATISATLIPAVAAVIIYVELLKWTTRPQRWFLIIAVVTALGSYIGPIQFYAANTPVYGKLALIVMQTIAAVIITGSLLRIQKKD